MVKLQPSSPMFGVGPADNTGKSFTTYCPGGTREGSTSVRRRPRKPRDIGAIVPPLPRAYALRRAGAGSTPRTPRYTAPDAGPSGQRGDGPGRAGRSIVIPHPAFAVEPWVLRETELNLDVLAQTESVFALSNGHLGLRGNLDEGEPADIPGTYLNAFYEERPLRYAETSYGNPEAGQTVVNITNGKIFRLLVGDEPFDVRYGQLRSHERVLDLRAGVLRRQARWISPVGVEVRLSTTRLVSFVQRAVAAVLYEVEPVDGATRLVVQSELVANEPPPTVETDPRAPAA